MSEIVFGQPKGTRVHGNKDLPIIQELILNRYGLNTLTFGTTRQFRDFYDQLKDRAGSVEEDLGFHGGMEVNPSQLDTVYKVVEGVDILVRDCHFWWWKNNNTKVMILVGEVNYRSSGGWYRNGDAKWSEFRRCCELFGSNKLYAKSDLLTTRESVDWVLTKAYITTMNKQPLKNWMDTRSISYPSSDTKKQLQEIVFNKYNLE